MPNINPQTDSTAFTLQPSGELTTSHSHGVAERTRPDSVTDWVHRINQAWERGLTRTLELARLLSEAKAQLHRGEWSRLCRSPLSKRTGEMIASIGRSLGHLNAQNSAQLPSAWNTLYYLARLGHAHFVRLIEQGRIHPRLSLNEARELLAEFRPQLPAKAVKSRVEQRLARFEAFVLETFPNWSDAERLLAAARLLELYRNIALVPTGPKDTNSGEAAVPISAKPVSVCAPCPASGSNEIRNEARRGRHIRLRHRHESNEPNPTPGDIP